MADVSLHMADVARAHYGPLTNQFESWLGEQGIRQAIIVSASDFLKDPSKGEKVPSSTQMAEFKDFIKQFSGFPQGVIDKDIGGISRQIYLNKPVAYGYDSDGDGVRDTAVIVAPHRDSTKLEIASGISGVPQNELKNLSGTDIDWQTFVIAHEIGHTGQDNHNKTSLVFEAGADEHGREFWARAHAAGLVTSKDVPADFIRMRALAAFSPDKASGMATHFTAAAIRLEGEGIAPSIDNEKFAKAWTNVSQMVAQEAGHSLITDESQIKILKDVMNKSGLIGMRMEAAGFSLSQDQKDLLTEMIDGKVPIDTGLKQLDAEALEKIQGYMSVAEMAAGYEEFRNNPHLMHETVRKMYLEGRFDGDLIGKQYAYEFLTTARQHAKEYFGVHDMTTKYEPPVFGNRIEASQAGNALHFQPH